MKPILATPVSGTGSAGFTLVELLVVISIAAIMMLFAVAPYNFYAEKARVRLSTERVEQVMNRAKLLAGTGYSRRDPNDASAPDKNVDLVVRLTQGSAEIVLSSIPAGTLPIAASHADRRLVERVQLERGVMFSQLGAAAGAGSLDIVYRSPTGNSEVWKSPDDNVVPVLVTDAQTSASGGIVGMAGALK